MIRDSYNQSPWFVTHVIRGLTDKKKYHLHVFRYSCSVFCAQPLPNTLKRACMQRERERSDSDTAFRQRLNGRIHTHTKLYLNTRFGKYSGKHSRLCLKLPYTAEKERAEQLCFLHDNLPFLNWED